jgi:hypothetical protein
VDLDLNWVFLYSFDNNMQLQEAMRQVLGNCSSARGDPMGAQNLD